MEVGEEENRKGGNEVGGGEPSIFDVLNITLSVFRNYHYCSFKTLYNENSDSTERKATPVLKNS